MQVTRIEDYKDGWFCGNFNPTAFKTKNCEVALKTHHKGEKWPTHYHKIAVEINLLIEGRMRINGTELFPGDVFVIEPNEVSSPEFLSICKIVVIKIPSAKNDKYVVEG